jgi:hypothetical protein
MGEHRTSNIEHPTPNIEWGQIRVIRGKKLQPLCFPVRYGILDSDRIIGAV